MVWFVFRTSYLRKMPIHKDLIRIVKILELISFLKLMFQFISFFRISICLTGCWLVMSFDLVIVFVTVTTTLTIEVKSLNCFLHKTVSWLPLSPRKEKHYKSVPRISNEASGKPTISTNKTLTIGTRIWKPYDEHYKRYYMYFTIHLPSSFRVQRGCKHLEIVSSSSTS